MKSSKFIIAEEEKTWKKVILINEIAHINRFAKEGFQIR